jgi:hypothetical protein
MWGKNKFTEDISSTEGEAKTLALFVLGTVEFDFIPQW